MSGQSPTESTQSGIVLKAGIVKLDITPGEPVRMSSYSGARRSPAAYTIHSSAQVLALRATAGARARVDRPDRLLRHVRTDPRRPLRPLRAEAGRDSPHRHAHPQRAIAYTKSNGHPNNVEYTKNLKARLQKESGGRLTR